MMIVIYNTKSPRLSIKKCFPYCKASRFGYTADTIISMSEKREKIIPKFQKKLSGFLSDEAGKISKEDVLKMGIIAMGIVGIYSIDQMNAGHWNADNYQTIHAPSNSHVNQ